MSATTPLFTPEQLQREGIPLNAQVSLRTQGTRVSYGAIPRTHLLGQDPPIEVFRNIARQGRDWHSVHEIELQFTRSQKRKTVSSLRLSLNPPLSPPEITARSLATPIAVWARAATDSVLREGCPFSLAELLTITCVQGELHLNDTVLFGTEKDGLHRYHSVVYCGRDMQLDEFSWLPSRAPNALSILQDIARHVGVTDPHRTVIEAYWNSPDELADILRAFIHRFGLAHAKALLGDSILQAVEERRLWEEIEPPCNHHPGQALIAFAEPLSTHGQLELQELDGIRTPSPLGFATSSSTQPHH